VPRLSELLERIRPAGTPGAPSEGEVRRRDQRRAGEIASIALLLASWEGEADAVVAAGRADADRLLADGRRRADQIDSRLPDHVAHAEADAAHASARQDEVEVERLRRATADTISELRARADARLPGMVEEVTEVIWSQVAPDAMEHAP
jgi:hypothetical protein